MQARQVVKTTLKFYYSWNVADSAKNLINLQVSGSSLGGSTKNLPAFSQAHKVGLFVISGSM